LQVPAGWILAKEAVRAPGSTFIACDFLVNPDCPSAHRYFVVAGNPVDAYGSAKRMLQAAGFALTEQYRPNCDGAATGGAACRLVATRNDDAVSINFAAPGQDVEGLAIGQPGKFVVEVRAYPFRKGGAS
jgi:hypothetical protein